MPRTTLRDGRILHWSERGLPDGVPVVFLHGCPDTRRASWSGHEAGRRAGVRLLAANRPGYGASTPAAPSYRRVVDDVAALGDSLGLEQFAVLGMSVGGTFSLACAALLPDRVTHATLVGTPGEASRMHPAYSRDDLDDSARAFFDSLSSGTTEENLQRVTPDFLAWRAGVDPDDPDDVALASRWLASLPPEDRPLVDGPPAEVAAGAREAIGVPDGYLADAALVFGRWPFGLEDVRCPVALRYGDHDAQAPPRNGEWLAERLADATVQVQPGLGHLESLVRSWDVVLGAAVGRV